MGFLSGSATFECFRIAGPQPRQFGPEHIEVLEKYAISDSNRRSSEQGHAGFLAGGHLFDRDFGLEKNAIGDALHCAMRIDTNQVPAAIRKAWLQMELAVLLADEPDRRPTKAQRQEAKDAVETRCDEAMSSGEYRKMRAFPILWDARNGVLYFGGTSESAAEVCRELFEKSFELELSRLSAGQIAVEWAPAAKRVGRLNDTDPALFLTDYPAAEVGWWNGQSGNYDFLGNEFLLWLWWYWDTQSDTLELPDDSEVTGMFARTLSLECPRGESGKGTVSSEGPTRLPEAIQAIRSGKLPRKAGLTLVRHGEHYDLTLQAESFQVSGARIQTEETSEGRGFAEDRLESLRSLKETLDLMFHAFCERRIAKGWTEQLTQMQEWLRPTQGRRKQARRKK